MTRRRSNIGQYRIIKLLEKTNTASIYKVQDTSGTLYALKIASKADKTHNDLIMREFQILKQINHPNIVRVTDMAIDDQGRAFFLSVFVPGKPLDACFHSFTKDFVDALLDITNALATLHNKGFIHGDLKPDHFLYDKKMRTTVLIDFGYARIPDDASIRTGTLGYIAPEVLKGIALDQRSDIYSLGVIVHDILAHRSITHPWQDIPGIHERVNILLRCMCSHEIALRPGIAEIYETLLPFGSKRHTEPLYHVGLPPTAFVGRQSIMDTLMKANSTALTIHGEIGVGKTRLLLELKFHFVQQGYVLFHYFPGEQSSLLESLCTFLGIQVTITNQAQDEYAVFHTILSGLIQHAQNTTTILLIDEIESLTHYDRALLRYIGFGIQDKDITIICTTADPQCTSDIGFNTVTLEPLTKQEIEQLILSTLPNLQQKVNRQYGTPHRFIRWIYKQSGGNPLYLVELLTLVFETKILVFRNHQWILDGRRFEKAKIPERIEKAISLHLEHLTKPEVMIMQTLAITETPIEPWVIGTALGNDCYSAIERLKLQGLVKEERLNDTRRVIIPNHIIRDIVKSSTSEHDAKTIARKLLGSLKPSTSMDSQYLLLVTALYDRVEDTKNAVKYAHQVAQHAERVYDYRTAIKFYRIIQKNTSDSQKMHTASMLKIAALLTTTGQYRDSLDVYKSLHQYTSRSIQRQISAGIGRTYHFMGDYEQAIIHLEQALQSFRSKRTEQALVIQTRLAYCFTVTGRFRDAELLIDRIRTLAQDLDNKSILSTTLYYRAILAYQKEDIEKSIAYCNEHIRFTEKNHLVRDTAFSTLLMSRVYQKQHDLNKALASIDSTITNLTRTNDTRALVNAMCCKADILSNQGKFTQAIALFTTTLIHAKQIDNVTEIISCLLELTNIHILITSYDRATSYAYEGLKYATDKNPFLRDLALIHYEQGELDKARELISNMTDKEKNPHYRQLAFMLDVEQSNTRCLDDSLKQFEDSITSSALNARQKAYVYIKIIPVLFTLKRYDKAASFLQYICDNTPVYIISDQVAQAYQKILDFYQLNGHTLDISEQIDHLMRNKILYHVVQLRRLKLEAQLSQPVPGDIIKELARELNRTIEIAIAINARTEISLCRNIQHQLFPMLIQDHTVRSPDPLYLDVFSQIAEVIEQDIGHDAFLDRLLDITIKATHAERGALFLNTPKGMHFILGRNMDSSTIQDAEAFSFSVIKDVHKNNIIFTQNALDDPDFSSKKSIQLHKIRSILCIPLVVVDNIIGALYMDSRFQGTMFREEDKHFLITVARILAAVIDKSITFKEVVDENIQLRESIIMDIGGGYLMGESPAIKKVYDLVDRVAATNAPVLLVGETGTGKGMVARLIHKKSIRKEKNFTVINCGTIPETLLESELFGHKKGSFTGAVADKAGLLEQAQGGTVFLDEITNTTAAFQAKLLEAIEDKIIRRIGETAIRKIDVRFLFATNKDIEIEVEENRLRKDLYYRINVFKIEIPPLRERGSDITLLARFFLGRSCQEIGKRVLDFTPDALKALRGYYWEGNVRELRHVIDRAVVLAKGTHITQHDLNIGSSARSDISSMQDLKKEAIIEVLENTRRNVSQTARILGVSRRTIQRYIQKYKL